MASKRRGSGGSRRGALGLLASVAVLTAACAGEPRTGSAASEAPAGEEVREEVPDGFVRASFEVEGMTCGGCALSARIALRRLEGVRDAGASLGEGDGPGLAWAIYDPAKVGPEELMRAIRDVGFSPRPTGG